MKSSLFTMKTGSENRKDEAISLRYQKERLEVPLQASLSLISQFPLFLCAHHTANHSTFSL